MGWINSAQQRDGRAAGVATGATDDGRTYHLTYPRGVDEVSDRLSPDADHHAIAVYGSDDLARRVTAANEAGMCVSWRDTSNDDCDEM